MPPIHDQMKKHKGKRPAFIVDVQLYYKDFQDRFDKKANFTTVAKFTGRTNTDDIEIFERCVSEKKHIITQNYKHFRKIKKSKPHSKVGIVGICTDRISQAIDQFGEMLKIYPSHLSYEGKLLKITTGSVKEDLEK